MAEKKKISLEESMARLEEIVSELENAKRKIQILQQGKDGDIEVVDVPEGVFSDEN